MTIKTIVYPSPEAPAFSSFALDYPQSWHAQPTPMFLALVIDGVERDGFHANIGVGVTRVPQETTLQMISISALEQSAPAFSEFTIIRDEITIVAGQQASKRFQSFIAEEIQQRVTQLQVLFFAPSDDRQTTKELFRIHATCLTNTSNDYEELFLNTVSSFRFLGSPS